MRIGKIAKSIRKQFEIFGYPNSETINKKPQGKIIDFHSSIFILSLRIQS
jgi:hypothetical protein